MLQDFNFSTICSTWMTAKWRKEYEQRPRRERAAFTLYRGPKSELGFPNEILHAALRDAQKLCSPEQELNCLPIEEFIAFDLSMFTPDFEHPSDPNKSVRDGWLPDVRLTRRGKSTRAKFPTWGFRAKCYIQNSDSASIEAVKQLFNNAGLKCGLGAYRPSQGGPFGTFSVVEVIPEPPETGSVQK